MKFSHMNIQSPTDHFARVKKLLPIHNFDV